MSPLSRLLILLGAMSIAPLCGADTAISVPLQSGKALTYYVTGTIEGQAPMEFLVDTGSGYVVVSHTTIDSLKQGGDGTYIKSISGIMANGARQKVDIYRVSRLTIGCCCVVPDVEVAAMPGARRPILGLSALGRIASFTIATSPPRLSLTGCWEKPSSSVAQR